MRSASRARVRSGATLRHRLASFLRGEESRSGLAAIEFAVIAPTLAMVLICTCDIGLGIYHEMQVETAANAGAQYAALHGFSTSGIASAVTTSTSGFPVSATPAPVQSCDCPNGTGVTPVTCGSTCADGTLAGTYVTVSAGGNYTTIIPYPMFPNSFPLSAAAVVRIQ